MSKSKGDQNKPLQDGFNEVAKVSLQIVYWPHPQAGVVICQNHVDFRTPGQKTC